MHPIGSPDNIFLAWILNGVIKFDFTYNSISFISFFALSNCFNMLDIFPYRYENLSDIV